MRKRWVIQSYDGSIWGPFGWTDYASNAVFFHTEAAALLASHAHVGSRVKEVVVHSADFEHENLIEDDRFVHTAYVSL